MSNRPDSAARIYIPIGTDCSVASYCRNEGLRKDAFPFDWVVAHPSAVLRILENDFSDFLVEENLIFLPPEKRILFKEDGVTVEPTDDIITPVVCGKCGILFPHDFSVEGRSFSAGGKYLRRIERLRHILSTNAEWCFVWANRPLNRWQSAQYASAGVNFQRCSRVISKTLSGI